MHFDGSTGCDCRFYRYICLPTRCENVLSSASWNVVDRFRHDFRTSHRSRLLQWFPSSLSVKHNPAFAFYHLRRLRAGSCLFFLPSKDLFAFILIWSLIDSFFHFFHSQSEDVLIAVGICTGVCLALTIFAMQTQWDFTGKLFLLHNIYIIIVRYFTLSSSWCYSLRLRHYPLHFWHPRYLHPRKDD